MEPLRPLTPGTACKYAQSRIKQRSTYLLGFPLHYAIYLLGIFVLGGLGLGFLRLDSDIPVASNCSAAISAACHPPPGDEDVALGLIPWGVVSSDEQKVGHCSLSSRPVKGLEQGKLYAGYQYKRLSQKTNLSWSGRSSKNIVQTGIYIYLAIYMDVYTGKLTSQVLEPNRKAVNIGL